MGAVAAAASMSGIAVNLSRGRSPPPRAISAPSMALHPAASTTAGWRSRTSLSSADCLRRRIGQPAVVVVGDQVVHGLRRARLVGADEAGRSAFDPAGDVDAPGAIRRHAATVVGHDSGRLRRTADRESACRGSRSRSAPARLDSRAPRRYPVTVNSTPVHRAPSRALAAASAGRPAGSGASRDRAHASVAELARISSLLRVIGSDAVGQVAQHQFMIGGVEHDLATSRSARSTPAA